MSAERLLDFVLYHRSRSGSYHLVDQLSVLEEQQRRYAHYPELGGSVEIVVRIELREYDLAILILSHGVDCRRQHPARSAPRSPAVHHDSWILLDRLLEVGIVDRDRCLRPSVSAGRFLPCLLDHLCHLLLAYLFAF